MRGLSSRAVGARDTSCVAAARSSAEARACARSSSLGKGGGNAGLSASGTRVGGEGVAGHGAAKERQGSPRRAHTCTRARTTGLRRPPPRPSPPPRPVYTHARTRSVRRTYLPPASEVVMASSAGSRTHSAAPASTDSSRMICARASSRACSVSSRCVSSPGCCCARLDAAFSVTCGGGRGGVGGGRCSVEGAACWRRVKGPRERPPMDGLYAQQHPWSSRAHARRTFSSLARCCRRGLMLSAGASSSRGCATAMDAATEEVTWRARGRVRGCARGCMGWAPWPFGPCAHALPCKPALSLRARHATAIAHQRAVNARTCSVAASSFSVRFMRPVPACVPRPGSLSISARASCCDGSPSRLARSRGCVQMQQGAGAAGAAGLA